MARIAEVLVKVDRLGDLRTEVGQLREEVAQLRADLARLKPKPTKSATR